MYEKFTDRARKVMQLADTEARRLNHEYVGSEHILLGLVKEGNGVAAHVLKGFSLDLETLRTGVERHIAIGSVKVTADKLPRHPEANQVTLAAIEEARKLGHDYVGTEHILLGLIRSGSLAAVVLSDSELKLEDVRTYTMKLLGNSFELIPCEVCGKPTTLLGTRRCNNCWEVEKRLASYIESPAGRAWVENMLNPPIAEPTQPVPIPRGEEDALPTDPLAIPTDNGDPKVYLLHYDEVATYGRVQKIVAVFRHEQTAIEAMINICKTPESRRAFFDSFGWPQPSDIHPGNFWVEAFPLKRGIPLLDDWYHGVDGHYHPGWDYEAVLRENEVTVTWDHQMVDGEGTISETPPELCGWGFSWKHGCIHVGQTTEKIARKASALFVRLWQLGVSASFCDKLMDGYIVYLERQENKRLTFLAEIDRYGDARPFLRLTREDWPLKREAFTNIEWKIIETLTPTDDEEMIVTFTKRKRSGKPE